MSITGMEMVTAGGDVLYADDTHNADLFWAARGAGPGFFAVVTRFDLKLYPLPAIHNYVASYELGAAPALSKWLPGTIGKMHPGVEVDVMLGPIDESGKPFVTLIAVAFAPSASEAADRIAPLRHAPLAHAGELVDKAATFAEVSAGVDATFPATRMAGDMYFSNAPLSDLLLKLAPFADHTPPAPSTIMLATFGGGHLTSEERYFNGRSGSLSVAGNVDFGVYAFWDDARDDTKNIAWVRAVMAAAKPFNCGSYVGEADLSTSGNRVLECFSSEAWKRLNEIKQKHDPKGVFHSYLTA